MTLYRCCFSKEISSRGLLIYRVHKNEYGQWARPLKGDPFTKIIKNAIVLELEVADIVSPFLTQAMTQQISPYHICLYREETVAIARDKWHSYFVPLEIKSESNLE